MSKNHFHGIDAYIARLVSCKAKQISRQAGFTDDDREDIEQDLVLDLLQRISEYDPAKAKQSTFAAHVVNNHAATLLARSKAAKRNHNRIAYSLNDLYEDKDGSVWEREELFDQDLYQMRLGRQSRPSEDLRDLQIDVQYQLKLLSPKARELCKRITHDHISSIAQDIGTPRTTLYSLLSTIRKSFIDAGLDEYI